MKFEQGDYITRGGQKAVITSIVNGAPTGYYLQPCGARVSTTWNVYGRRTTRQTRTDIVAPYPQIPLAAAPSAPTPPPPPPAQRDTGLIADMQFIRKRVGLVATVANPPGHAFPDFKTHPFKTMEALNAWVDRRNLNGAVLKVEKWTREGVVWQRDDDRLVA